tara:strand:- start:825 stop:1841 length:1017 start_codon:yes stop_codon:yes gene_type:complete
MIIKIDNRKIKFFSDVVINYKFTSFASIFSFKARFDSNNEEHRKIFKPLSFKKVEIFNDQGDLKMNGIILTHSFSSDLENNLVSISGYSKSGILESCSIPYESYPLEKNNVSLRDLTGQLFGIFGIDFIVDPPAAKDMDLVYEKVTAEPGETIKSHISKLASQRNIIIKNNENGSIVFTKPEFSITPKFSFNKSNVISMSTTVNGQDMHSSIDVIRQLNEDDVDVDPFESVSNPMIGLKKVLVKVLSDGADDNMKGAAKNILASELRDIMFEIKIDKELDVDCGDTVSIINDEIFIYKKVNLIVDEVILNISGSENQTIIKAKMPEAYTGETPKNIFE